MIFFHYAETRSGFVPKEFLFPPDHDPPAGEGFFIQSDGYAGYNELARMPGVRGQAACWAHVRRRFVDAAKGRAERAPAHEMVALIAKLYRIERAIRDLPVQEKRTHRQAKARPVLEKIKAWLDERAKTTLPKGLLGQAIAYALGLWPQLLVYLEDGHLDIDNNAAENAIRPFVVGREGWLFSGSPRGAQTRSRRWDVTDSASDLHCATPVGCKRPFWAVIFSPSEIAIVLTCC